MNDAAWCCELGRLTPSDLLHSRSLRFFQRLLTLPEHCQARRVLVQQLREPVTGDAKARLPVHLHPAARTLRELDCTHGAGLVEVFVTNITQPTREDWSLSKHEQRLKECDSRLKRILPTNNAAPAPPTDTTKYRLHTEESRPHYDRLRKEYARWLRTKLLQAHANRWFTELAQRYADEQLTSAHRSNGPQFNFSAGSRDNTAQWLRASSHHKLTPAYSRGVTLKLRLRVGSAFELPATAGHMKSDQDTTRFNCRCCSRAARGTYPHIFECPGLLHLVDDLRHSIDTITENDKPPDPDTPYSGQKLAVLCADNNNLRAVVAAASKFAAVSAVAKQAGITLRNKDLPNSTWHSISSACIIFLGRVAFELAHKEHVHKHDPQPDPNDSPQGHQQAHQHSPQGQLPHDSSSQEHHQPPPPLPHNSTERTQRYYKRSYSLQSLHSAPAPPPFPPEHNASSHPRLSVFALIAPADHEETIAHKKVKTKHDNSPASDSSPSPRRKRSRTTTGDGGEGEGDGGGGDDGARRKQFQIPFAGAAGEGSHPGGEWAG